MARKLRPGEKSLWDSVAKSVEPIKPALGTDQNEFDFAPAESVKKMPAPEPVAQVRLRPFEIGSKAKTSTAVTAPAPKHAPTMDAKTFSKMARGRMSPEATLDLHGLTVAEAHPALTNFILKAATRHLRLVLVITGKGQSRDQKMFLPTRAGILRQSVPTWLKQAGLSPYILEISEAHAKHGGRGAYYVYLRRRRT